MTSRQAWFQAAAQISQTDIDASFRVMELAALVLQLPEYPEIVISIKVGVPAGE